MSQSDYLKLKKIKTELTSKKLPSVLEYNNYYPYKDYSLEKLIVNNSITYNLLPLPNTIIINNIVNKYDSSNCCVFPVCNNTNTRFNRIVNNRAHMISNIPLNVKNIHANDNNKANKCECK